MPWKTNRTASITNKQSQFGIMGGLANRRTYGASSNRATNRLVIPRGASSGFAYMKMHGILSRNPLGSGGVGKVVKSKPCHCKGLGKTKVEGGDLGGVETPFGSEITRKYPITDNNIRRAVTCWETCCSGSGYGPMSDWDTSAVKNMSRLFYRAYSFNCDISAWNTSNVTNMKSMFQDAAAFNGNISGWITKSVTDMSLMFSGARAFNQPLNWDTSIVTDMGGMFYTATAFNQPINWNTSNVTRMNYMFQNAYNFNQDISGWITSSVTNMDSMFLGAKVFHKDIGSWDTSKVTTMDSMFQEASAFNGDIGSWDTSKVTTMDSMFHRGFAFDQVISKWNTSKVTNMDSMFYQAAAFNQDLSGWCVEDISSQPQDFRTGTLTNHDQMPHWDASCICTDASGIKTDRCNVASGVKGCKIPDSSNICCVNWLHGSGCIDSSGLCYLGDTDMSLCGRHIDISCTPFTDILGGGETPLGSGTVVIPITQDNIHAAVKQCISGGSAPCCTGDPSYGYMGVWDTSAVTDMSRLFYNASNFNCDISGWNTRNVTDMNSMFQGATVFNQPLNWDTSSVTDMDGMFTLTHAFNQDISGWNTANVQSMMSMFAGASAFNGDISKWNTANVQYMTGMLTEATKFNQDISKWNTSNVTDMNSMFAAASAFNGDISGWNTANVQNMNYMFYRATDFSQNLSAWCVEDISSQPTGFSNQRMTRGHMPIWDASCICIDASGIKTDRCNVASGVKGCKIPGSSNICCVNWLHGSGCIDSSGLCYLGDTDMSLCGRPIDISCSPQETLGGGETPLGSGTGVIPITQANIQAAVNYCISGGSTTCCTGDPSYGIMSDWDTSAVKNMSGLFQDASGFNCDISVWDTGNVTDMNSMFQGATVFNQPLNWDTSSVQYMNGMFALTHAFNQDISGWNTANVQVMDSMFYGASAFNGDISKWNTANVQYMNGMLTKATKFNQDISKWNTSSVTNMNAMFYRASAFNGDISGWNTSSVTSMNGMFQYATDFSQNLSAWCVEDISSQPTGFSNHLMTHAQMPIWDASCICTDARGIKTDRCNVALGVKGCKIPDSSNICCVNWLHGSGCIDSSGLCYLGDTDMSLCGRPIDISCSPFTETLGGTIQAKSSDIPCRDLSNNGVPVTNDNSHNAFGAPGQGYYCCMSGSDLCNNIPGCLKDGSINRASMVCVSGCEDIPCQDVVDISNVGKWKRIADMTTARMGLGLAATSNGKIYAVGGQDAAGKTLKSAEVYDPKLDTWHNIADMSYARATFGLAAIDDKIYAVGGYGDISHLKSAEVYDPSENTWTDISSMTTERASFGLASLNGKLYAVGGYDDDDDLIASVERYDPSTKNWTAAASMTKDRSQFGIAALEASDMPSWIKQYPEGLLYVAGGMTADTGGGEYDTQWEVYEPSSNNWQSTGSLDQSGLWWPGMAALHGKIYIVGGWNGPDGKENITASGEVYEHDLDHPEYVSAMSEPRALAGLAALNGKLYTAGGTAAPSSASVLKTGEVYTPYPS